MKTFSALFVFTAAAFAGDTITTVPRPAYLGGGSTSVVKDSSGKTTATATTIERPKYLGGGSVTTVKATTGKTTAAATSYNPAYLGGGTKSAVKTVK